MPLKETYTIFMLPLSIDPEKWNVANDSIWEPAELKLEKDILYPHIQQWLQAAANSKNRESMPQKPQNFSIYSLRNRHADASKKQQLAIWRKIVGTEWCLEKDGIAFKFFGKDNNLLGTKLIVSPYTRVGLLMFTLQLSEANAETDRLVTLNYRLHKIDNQAPQIVCVPPSAPLHPKKLEELQQITVLLQSATTDEGMPRWTLVNLIRFLLHEFNGAYTLMNSIRLHLFTYLRVTADENSRNLQEVFLRIIRGENSNYLPMMSNTIDSAQIMQTFQNIFIGSSVEGGGIMTIEPNEEQAATDSPASGHIANFGAANLPQRYLWIYLLAIMQRHTLLQIAGEITAIDHSSNTDYSLTTLHSMAERVALLKASTYFTDVSDYTQHNQFYHFCATQLAIRQHFDELSEKMNLLETVIASKKDESDDVKNNRLTIILAILTVASATCDTLTVLTLDKFNPISGIVLALALVVLLFAAWNWKK